MATRKQLKNTLERYETLIFENKEYDTSDFYNLKRELLKGEYLDLIQIFEVLEAMIEKRHNDLMNRRLNLLTIWSTIFLPLSFYTGLWGMNFSFFINIIANILNFTFIWVFY